MNVSHLSSLFVIIVLFIALLSSLAKCEEEEQATIQQGSTTDILVSSNSVYDQYPAFRPPRQDSSSPQQQKQPLSPRSYEHDYFLDSAGAASGDDGTPASRSHQLQQEENQRQQQHLLPVTPVPAQSVFEFFDAIANREHRAAQSLAVDCNQGFDPCAPHGKCSSSRCVCSSEPLKGFWSGDDCKECDIGWAGQECKIECKGGACNRCNDHGKCNEGVAGDGTCNCQQDQFGYWDGVDCSSCKAGFFGENCDKSCPGAEFGQLPCWGRGECQANKAGEGFCVCDAGWGTEHGCSDCDCCSWDANCISKCDGYIAADNVPCSGHGKCFNGTSANGTCQCDPSWATYDCSLQCPGKGCSGHGKCRDGPLGDATCQCERLWSPPDCSRCLANMTGWDCTVTCPLNPLTFMPCSNNGECVLVNNISVCVCAAGYAGPYCDHKCPGNPIPCSGNGYCEKGNNTCVCFQDPIRGYWSGPLCDRCDVRYNNSYFCNVSCPLYANQVCNGHGHCFDGVCMCDRVSTLNPFEYCGTACGTSSPPNVVDSNLQCMQCTCEYCPDQFAAGDCISSMCPAVTSTDPAYACNGNGRCREGHLRSGGCSCYTGWAGHGCNYQCPTFQNQSCGGYARGICNATYNQFDEVTVYCHCRDGFAGPACDLTCPRTGDFVCTGHGTCNDTNVGDGKCVCDPGWAGEACNVPCLCNVWNGVCDNKVCGKYKTTDTCYACTCFGNYTGLCDRCLPGIQGRTCEGVCVHGNTSGKRCMCEEYWSGPGCDVPCPRDPINQTICGGNGVCLWGDKHTGKCDCNTNWYGADCTKYCDPADCISRDGLEHPQCNVDTGQCECLDSTLGRWAGDTCSVCIEGYFGSNCEQKCACSDHGSCDKNSGECSCFQSKERGFYSGQQCDQCSPGFIGTNCERRSVAYTRVAIETPAIQQHGGSPNVFGGVPSADVLAMDERIERMYAGSFPLVMFDANMSMPGTFMTMAESSTAGWNNTILLPDGDGNTTTRLCYDEVAYVFFHEDNVFFLMHPQMQCNVTARLLMQDRRERTLNFTAAEQVWEMPYPATWRDCEGCAVWGNRTSRVVDADSYTESKTLASEADTTVKRKDPLLTFFMAQPKSGQSNAYETSCIVVRIDISRVITAGTRKTAASAKYLGDTYEMNQITLRHPVASASEDSEFIMISGRLQGSSSFDTWEVLLFKWRLGGFEPSDPLQASLRTKVACWPKLGSSTIALAKCDLCSKAVSAAFLGRSIVIAMNHPETVFVAWLRHFDPEIAPAQGPATKPFFGIIRGKCERAKWNWNSRSITGATTGVTEFNLPEMVVFLASANAPGTDVVSMALDAQVEQVHLSLTVFPTSSLMIKFTLADETLAILGTKQLGFVSAMIPVSKTTSSPKAQPETFRRLYVDNHTRVMYGVLTSVTPLKFAGFLLYDALTVTPNIADQRGGTTIVVNGTGFRNVYKPGPPSQKELQFPAKCRFSNGDKVEAIALTGSGITCVTTLITEDDVAASCALQVVEVSLFGDTWFTNNDVALRRVRAAKIEGSAFPEIGPLEGGNTVRFFGSGFIDSPFAVCKFFSNNTKSAETEVLISKLTYVSRGEGTCVQPSARYPSPDFPFLDISMDGQLFMETTPPRYTIVGKATNISTVPTLTVAAQFPRTPVTIDINIVDSLNHWVGNLDPNTRRVCIPGNIYTVELCSLSQFPWREQNDGYPWGPCRQLEYMFTTNATRCRDVQPNTGVVSFDDFAFVAPRVGLFTMRFEYPADPRWFSITRIYIVPGKPYALSLSNRKAILERPTFIQNVPLSPAPEIIVLDELGNKVLSPPGTLEVTATAYYKFDRNNSEKISQRVTLKKAPDADTVRFPALFLDFLHGVTHYVKFTSSPPLIEVESPPLRTTLCDNAAFSYKVPLESFCRPCPPEGAVCNGTETILVLPGYWRGNSTTNIYKCKASATICLGANAADGAFCAEGYHGPMCSLCDKGWGKSGATKCQQCPPLGTSIALIVVSAFFIIIALTGWVVKTLRQAQVTDLSIILRTVVNHMQATGKLGEFSTQWDPFLKEVFDLQNNASGLNFSGLSSLSCIISMTGNDYEVIFIGYMALPSLTVVMTGIVLGTVRLLKLKPVLTDKLRADVIEEVKNMPSARIGVLLEKYPWYTVATTTVSIFMFTLYQTLITQATAVLNCRELTIAPGVTQQYLAVDMSIKCTDSGDHKFKTAAYIAAVAYGVGIPSAFVFGYRVVLQSLGNKDLVAMMFQFLVGGYKAHLWYWQAVIMVRKLVLVLVITFVGDNPQLQSYGGMWTMSIALVLQIWFNPNERDVFNRVEALSLAIITVTLNLGLLYFWDKMPVFGKNVLTAFLILVTMGVIIMFAYYMYEPMKEVATAGLKQVRGALSDYMARRNAPQEDKSVNLSEIRPDYVDQDQEMDGKMVRLSQFSGDNKDKPRDIVANFDIDDLGIPSVAQKQWPVKSTTGNRQHHGGSGRKGSPNERRSMPVVSRAEMQSVVTLDDL